MLLFELSPTLPFLALNAIAFSLRQHLLVLDTELSSVEVEVVHGVNDLGSFIGSGKVCKCESTEDTIVEMVVESVWQRQVHIGHDLHELFFLNRKGDVLDDDCSRDQVLVTVLVVVITAHRGHAHVGAAKVRKAIRVGHLRYLVEPALWMN